MMEKAPGNHTVIHIIDKSIAIFFNILEFLMYKSKSYFCAYFINKQLWKTHWLSRNGHTEGIILLATFGRPLVHFICDGDT